MKQSSNSVFRILAAVFTVLVLVAAQRPVGAEAIAIRATAIPLNPADPGQENVGRLHYMGGLVLNSPDKRFGGLSGLTVAVDGGRMLAVSDRGYWVWARLREDADGRLVGIEDAELAPMLDEYRQPISGSRRDAEAIAHGTGVSVIVSFERRHRLWRYDISATPEDAVPVSIPVPEELKQAPRNGGLEAITVLPNGQLLAITENMVEGAGERVGWLMQPYGTAQSRLTYTPKGIFRPTDMATLPGGDVLVLERRYTKAGGAAARIARIAAADIRPGARLRGEELAIIAPPLNVDNMEGLAVVTGADGKVYLYVLSDDNYKRTVQRTLLMKFRLDPPPD